MDCPTSGSPWASRAPAWASTSGSDLGSTSGSGLRSTAGLGSGSSFGGFAFASAGSGSGVTSAAGASLGGGVATSSSPPNNRYAPNASAAAPGDPRCSTVGRVCLGLRRLDGRRRGLRLGLRLPLRLRLRLRLHQPLHLRVRALVQLVRIGPEQRRARRRRRHPPLRRVLALALPSDLLRPHLRGGRARRILLRVRVRVRLRGLGVALALCANVFRPRLGGPFALFALARGRVDQLAPQLVEAVLGRHP